VRARAGQRRRGLLDRPVVRLGVEHAVEAGRAQRRHRGQPAVGLAQQRGQVVGGDQALAEVDGRPEQRLQPADVVQEQLELAVVQRLAERLDAVAELLEARDAGEAVVEVEPAVFSRTATPPGHRAAQALGDLGREQAAAALASRRLSPTGRGRGASRYRDVEVVLADLALDRGLDDAQHLLAQPRPAAAEAEPDLVEVEDLEAAHRDAAGWAR
jgi:hypothetical protein